MLSGRFFRFAIAINIIAPDVMVPLSYTAAFHRFTSSQRIHQIRGICVQFCTAAATNGNTTVNP